MFLPIYFKLHDHCKPQEAVLMAMAKDDAKEHDKFHACLHWAKEKLSNFRTDERRKVKIIEC